MPDARCALLYQNARNPHKGHYTACRTSTLEMLDWDYNKSVWSHIYTDGSSDAAVRNSGAGSLSALAMENTFLRLLAADGLSSSYWPNLLLCMKLPSAATPPLSNIVFLINWKSAVPNLQSPRQQLERDTQCLLCELSQHSKVAVLWITAHCGLVGNKKADCLAKSGKEQEKPNLGISYEEAKALNKQRFSQKWMQALNPPSHDQMHHLPRYQQNTIFRFRTGYSYLPSHLYRLGLSHRPNCLCKTAPKTPEHILHSCPL